MICLAHGLTSMACIATASLYPAHPWVPSASSSNPKLCACAHAPPAGTTTNKTDFVPFQVPAEAARAARPQPALQVERQPFQAQSTYRDTFIPMVNELRGIFKAPVCVFLSLLVSRPSWVRCPSGVRQSIRIPDMMMCI